MERRNGSLSHKTVVAKNLKRNVPPIGFHYYFCNDEYDDNKSGAALPCDRNSDYVINLRSIGVMIIHIRDTVRGHKIIKYIIYNSYMQ